MLGQTYTETDMLITILRFLTGVKVMYTMSQRNETPNSSLTIIRFSKFFH